MNAEMLYARPQRAAAVLFAAGVIASLAGLGFGQNYTVLDSIEGSRVELATFPVRPMLLIEGVDDDHDELWAINHHDSTVLAFVGNATTATPYRVPSDPVAIAFWAGPTSGTEDDAILVVCRGNWAVAVLDRTTGVIEAVIQMRDEANGLPVLLADGTAGRIGRMAEPGDIVVDPSPGHPRAFVSCSASDSVIQINLTTNQVESVFDEWHPSAQKPRWKQPLFLSLVEDTEGVKVLVAPLTSGNNTTWGKDLTSGQRVESVAADCQALGEIGLPDEDLFRITPWSAGNPGGVTAIATGVGTILFGNAVRSGKLWQLNTDAQNSADRQGEPSAQGIFSRDRITVVDLASGAIDQTIVLDPPEMGGPPEITENNTVGQPFALTFDPAGNVLVAGLLTDNVMVRTTASPSTLRKEWDLPNGAIPRGLLMRDTSAGTRAVVYCWGTNEILEWSYSNTPAIVLTRDLGEDPTPPDVQAGRRQFFDGSNSRHKNLSCASCHIEGGSDLLVWNLSNLAPSGPTSVLPIDDKGGMVTQTLVGIERVSPFHWRGERRLSDFNDFAFEGLLGGTEPPQNEFQELKAYLFSLRNPANPRQDRRRVLNDSIVLQQLDPNHTPSAIAGEDKFRNKLLFDGPAFTCSACHAMPTGTVSDINPEQDQVDVPRRSNLKPAAFTELYRKTTPFVPVVAHTGCPTSTGVIVNAYRGRLGIGFFHEGSNNSSTDVNTLARAVNTVVVSTLTEAPGDMDDVGAFLLQWDQGMAPAAHFASLLSSATQTTSVRQLTNYLVPQARVQSSSGLPNCDVVAFGKVFVGGALVERRWWFDRGLDQFLCEDPLFTPRPLSTFTAPASLAAGESNVFVGVPVGMGERFGIDFDVDGHRNRASVEVGNEYDPNIPAPTGTSTPTIPLDEPKLLWKTARVARVVFSTDELTTGFVEYKPHGSTGPWKQVPTGDYSRRHSVVLTDLLPSTPDNGGIIPLSNVLYDVRASVRNRAVATYVTQDLFGGNPSGTFQTGNFIQSSTFNPALNPIARRRVKSHVLQSLAATPTSPTAGYTGPFTIDFNVVHRRGASFDGAGVLNRLPAPNRVVVGHLLLVRSGLASLVVPATPPGNSPQLASKVFLNCVPGAAGCSSAGGLELTVENISGTGAGVVFLHSRPTGDLGNGFITFDLTSGLQSGDQLVFAIDAVVEMTGTASVTNGDLVLPANYGTPYVDDKGGFMQWVMPDVLDENSVAAESRATVSMSVP